MPVNDRHLPTARYVANTDDPAVVAALDSSRWELSVLRGNRFAVRRAFSHAYAPQSALLTAEPPTSLQNGKFWSPPPMEKSIPLPLSTSCMFT